MGPSMLKIVVDTNIWIRALLGGRLTIPVLRAWLEGRFKVVISEPMMEELDDVCQRPRLKKHIDHEQAQKLMRQLAWRGIFVTPTTIPPLCRDIKDHPVLATAIDGQADAIVTGDSDIRADEALRSAMDGYGIRLWGINTLLAELRKRDKAK